jgi:hypothetical protein
MEPEAEDADAEEAAAAKKVEVVEDHRPLVTETIIVVRGNAVVEVIVIMIDHRQHAEVGASALEAAIEAVIEIVIEMASAEAAGIEVAVAAAKEKKELAVVERGLTNHLGSGNTRMESVQSSTTTW